MGRASRANPLSRDGGTDPEQVHTLRLQRLVGATVQTPRQFERFLSQFPEDDREDVRRLTRPFCAFVPAAIAREDELIARAATVAVSLAGGAR